MNAKRFGRRDHQVGTALAPSNHRGPLYEFVIDTVTPPLAAGAVSFTEALTFDSPGFRGSPDPSDPPVMGRDVTIRRVFVRVIFRIPAGFPRSSFLCRCIIVIHEVYPYDTIEPTDFSSPVFGNQNLTVLYDSLLTVTRPTPTLAHDHVFTFSEDRDIRVSLDPDNIPNKTVVAYFYYQSESEGVIGTPAYGLFVSPTVPTDAYRAAEVEFNETTLIASE